MDTPLSHSQRVLDALRSPKQLIVVPGVAHNDAMTAGVHEQIRAWLDSLFRKT